MLSDALFCQLADGPHALPLISLLHDEAVGEDELSLLFARRSAQDEAFVAAIPAGTLGAFSHIDLFPVAGPMLTCGPLQEPLRAAALIRDLGGLAGALAHLGLPVAVASGYACALRHGHALLVVHGRAGQRRETVDRAMKRCGDPHHPSVRTGQAG
jgi:hypothetical protein